MISTIVSTKWSPDRTKGKTRGRKKGQNESGRRGIYGLSGRQKDFLLETRQ